MTEETGEEMSMRMHRLWLEWASANVKVDEEYHKLAVNRLSQASVEVDVDLGTS